MGFVLLDGTDFGERPPCLRIRRLGGASLLEIRPSLGEVAGRHRSETGLGQMLRDFR
jgi:hypothetical protein